MSEFELVRDGTNEYQVQYMRLDWPPEFEFDFFSSKGTQGRVCTYLFVFDRKCVTKQGISILVDATSRSTGLFHSWCHGLFDDCWGHTHHVTRIHLLDHHGWTAPQKRRHTGGGSRLGQDIIIMRLQLSIDRLGDGNWAKRRGCSGQEKHDSGRKLHDECKLVD